MWRDFAGKPLDTHFGFWILDFGLNSFFPILSILSFSPLNQTRIKAIYFLGGSRGVEIPRYAPSADCPLDRKRGVLPAPKDAPAGPGAFQNYAVFPVMAFQAVNCTGRPGRKRPVWEASG